MHRIIAICGSQREKGNTELFLQHALDRLAHKGAETELISLKDRNISGCCDCSGCMNTGECVQKDDFQVIYNKMKQAEALIIGSPVYVSSITPEVKALIDRSCFCGRRDPRKPFYHKVGSPMVVAHRAGQNFAIAEINFFFMYMEMVISGATYWPLAFGRNEGEVLNDKEGIATAESLAENIWWLLNRINSA